MPTAIRLLVPAFLALFLTADPVGAQQAASQAPSNDDCQACHGDPTATGAGGRPIAVAEAQYRASVHGQAGLACVDCHRDLARTAEFPHSEQLAPADCRGCHDGAVSEYEVSAHASARRIAADSPAATCADCHGRHDIAPSADPQSRTYPLNLPDTCGHCHGDLETIKRGHIRAGDVFAQYHDSIHGQALRRAGLLVVANCSHCHGSHAIRLRTDPQSSVHRTNVASTCGQCHEGVAHRYNAGVHGSAMRAGNATAPVCTDCHTAHRIQRVDVATWRLEAVRECGTCHDDKIATYRDTFHGQVTALGFVRTATCADCHDAHDIFPKADRRSTVSGARRVERCQRCHSGATPSFAQYDPHADRHNRERSPVLYYAGRFMDLLLVSVFAFFGVHTLLWLQRAVQERRPRDEAEGKGEDTTEHDDRAS